MTDSPVFETLVHVHPSGAYFSNSPLWVGPVFVGPAFWPTQMNWQYTFIWTVTAITFLQTVMLSNSE